MAYLFPPSSRLIKTLSSLKSYVSFLPIFMSIMHAREPKHQWGAFSPRDSSPPPYQLTPPRNEHLLPASSSSLSSEEDDYFLPSTPPDTHVSLDSVWESVRKAKERSMAAQPSKIKSLERHRGSPTPPPLQTRTSEPYQQYKQPTKLQKGKS